MGGGFLGGHVDVWPKLLCVGNMKRFKFALWHNTNRTSYEVGERRPSLRISPKSLVFLFILVFFFKESNYEELKMFVKKNPHVEGELMK